MARLDRILLITTLCISGVIIAVDQTVPTASATLAEQVIARDIQDIKELIRDTSWPVKLEYNPNAYYELYESQAFKDKVTIRITTLDKPDYIFELFCVEIPREWQISVKEVSTSHFDALDALLIGCKDANPAIVKASLNLLPYTKSALASGKTTDFMDHVFIVNGKFKVDQFIEAACDGLVYRVNGLRIRKFGGLLFTAALLSPKAICGYENPIETVVKVCCESLAKKPAFEVSQAAKTILSKDRFGDVVGMLQQEVPAQTTKSLLTATNLKYLGAATSTTAAALWHKLEQGYIDRYITSLELLINSEKTWCDKELTKKRLVKLQAKLSWFGLQRNATTRLQVLIDKLG